ncbi:hypothetical protein F0562_007390 [Nyssa sinensis]|uniref:Uncharacterized protein n=1 Tax=Nyssa sinensis TaxID=561372 RepID=A0A5J5A391_9ASTE|nr:hypothetical protein F0562_007390 [Nyssa sinensis]
MDENIPVRTFRRWPFPTTTLKKWRRNISQTNTWVKTLRFYELYCLNSSVNLRQTVPEETTRTYKDSFRSPPGNRRTTTTTKNHRRSVVVVRRGSTARFSGNRTSTVTEISSICIQIPTRQLRRRRISGSRDRFFSETLAMSGTTFRSPTIR